MSEGRIIASRYRLQAKLGQGGMGSVYRAVHLEMGIPVAVKLLDPMMAESKVAVARFRREAQAAASIRSQHVVQILDYGVDGESPYLVMEYLNGESLATRLSRQGVLPPAFIAHIMGQVSKALERAHAIRIVHRDLKPDNIFLVPEGGELVAKVLDFGIAKTETNSMFDGTIETQSGSILGTPHYMSPEQATGRDTVDHRADIWSMGVIVFQCLTGFRPFNGSTVGGLVVSICTDPLPRPSERGSVPKGTDAWFAKAVARNKAERFGSITEAVAALRTVCEATESEQPGGAFDGLLREPTAIASQRGASISSSLGPGSLGPGSLGPGSLGSVILGDGTVSPAAHTVGGLRRRRSYLSWTLAAVAVAGLIGATLYARSTMMQERYALSAQVPAPTQAPIQTSPAQPTLASAPPATAPTSPALSVLGASATPPVGPVPRDPTSAAVPARAALGKTEKSAPLTRVVSRSDSGAESQPTPPAADKPADKPADRTQELPAAGPTAAAVQPTTPAAKAESTQRIEDRLAF